jgi:hypothetical protein
MLISGIIWTNSNLFHIRYIFPRSILFFPDKMIEAVLLYVALKYRDLIKTRRVLTLFFSFFFFSFFYHFSFYKEGFILVSDISTWKI